MSKLAEQYFNDALASSAPGMLLDSYSVYLQQWDDDSTLKTFDEWLNS